MAGPGHKPIKPQPVPKKVAPTVKFLSISLKVGREKLSANQGFTLCFCK